MVRMKYQDSGEADAHAVDRAADGEIIRACQAGDQEAFAQLVQRYHGRAYWVAYGLLSNEEESRDVVQAADEQSATEFYRAVVLREGTGEAQMLRDHGLLVRIDFAADVVVRAAERAERLAASG